MKAVLAAALSFVMSSWAHSEVPANPQEAELRQVVSEFFTALRESDIDKAMTFMLPAPEEYAPYVRAELTEFSDHVVNGEFPFRVFEKSLVVHDTYAGILVSDPFKPSEIPNEKCYFKFHDGKWLTLPDVGYNSVLIDLSKEDQRAFMLVKRGLKKRLNLFLTRSVCKQ